MSIDPKANIQPEQSPYSLSNNTPIIGNDPNGDICIPCIYAIKVGVNILVQGAVHSSVDLYSQGWDDFSLSESLSKVDMADAFIWSAATAPGASTVAKIGIVSAADINANKGIALIDIQDIEDKTGLNIPIKNKTYTAAAVDGVFNSLGAAATKSIGNKVSKYANKPIADATKRLDGLKGELGKYGLLTTEGNLKSFRVTDPIVRYQNRGLYNEAQRLTTNISTQTTYHQTTADLMNAVVTSGTVGTANATSKKIGKNIAKNAQQKSSNSAPTYPNGVSKYGDSIVY